MALDSVCFISPSPSFSVISRVDRLRLVLFHPRSVWLLGYFYNDTLCNVNYCRHNELEEVFQDAASPYFSLSLLSRYYLLSLSFSFPLVSSAGVSKGSCLVILGTDTSWIFALSRTSTELISLRDSFAHASPVRALLACLAKFISIFPCRNWIALDRWECDLRDINVFCRDDAIYIVIDITVIKS